MAKAWKLSQNNFTTTATPATAKSKIKIKQRLLETQQRQHSSTEFTKWYEPLKSPISEISVLFSVRLNRKEKKVIRYQFNSTALIFNEKCEIFVMMSFS